jgi:sulfur relay (sulfurtransferase) complex TusBCD TusD component (DsrE family)
MSASPTRTVFIFSANGIGQTGDDALKVMLARKFLTLIAQADPLPTQLCFYTEGVWLCVQDSPVLAELTTLEQQGVELVICSTCVERFSIADQIAVGVVGGMPDIITAIANADKVVTL